MTNNKRAHELVEAWYEDGDKETYDMLKTVQEGEQMSTKTVLEMDDWTWHEYTADIPFVEEATDNDVLASLLFLTDDDEE